MSCGWQDHVRRMKRFKNYVLSEEFPAEYNQFDAKSIAKLLDKQVNIRLTSQSQYGGSIPVPTTKSKSKKRSRAEEEDDSNSDEDGSEADSESEPELPEGTQSKRAAKKLERNLSTKTRKLAIKEKLSALKAGTSTTTTKPKTFVSLLYFSLTNLLLSKIIYSVSNQNLHQKRSLSVKQPKKPLELFYSLKNHPLLPLQLQ